MYNQYIAMKIPAGWIVQNTKTSNIVNLYQGPLAEFQAKKVRDNLNTPKVTKPINTFVIK